MSNKFRHGYPFQLFLILFTLVAYNLNAQNQPPVVSGIPDQSIAEGSSFVTINLDDYVDDPDNLDSEMSWGYSGNSELGVDITSRVATITIPGAEWSGSETITFTATDPGLLSGSDAAVFEVTAVNDPPVVSGIPDQSIAEGSSFATITLDNYVTDIDNDDSEIVWTSYAVTNLTVSIVNRVATITPNDINWNGSETITFEAVDPGELSDFDTAIFTVTPVNDPPEITGQNPITVLEDNSITIEPSYLIITDPDNTPAQMSVIAGSGDYYSVTDDNTVTPSANHYGNLTVPLTVYDGNAYSNTFDATVTVTPINDPPVLSDIQNQTIAEGNSFATISLDNFVQDPDNYDSEISWTYSGNSILSVSIDPATRIATITITNVEWNGSETITFTATDPNLLSESDPAVFTITPVNDAPEVTDIEDQTIAEGGSFVTIPLNDYVDDPDNTDNEITWTYTGNLNLSVVINPSTRVATITPLNTEWNGSETITFRATDPAGLYNITQAAFTVTAINDPPVVSNIPDQSIAEGATFITIPLDTYVHDTDNTDSQMTWTYTGNLNLSVTINPSTRVATITPLNTEWNGSETITFEAVDPGELSDFDEVTFTVTPVNDAPVVSDIPDQSIAEGGTFTTIPLDNFVHDTDNADSQITWTFSGNNQLAVTIDPATRVATITPLNTEWNGSETITFGAADPGSLYDSDDATFTVTPVNDAPVVSNIPDQTIPEGSVFIDIPLDNYVHDTDNTDNQISWFFSGNSQLSVSINPATRIASVAPPDIEWNGSETITFMAADPDSLNDTDPAVFTVTPVNDAPVLSGIETSSLGYFEGSGQVIITHSINVSDIDNQSLISASVAISSGYISSEDQLIFTGGGNISGTWSSAAGVLNLSGTATHTEYRDALRSVSYVNSDATSPSTNPRIISFTVNDGTDNCNMVFRSITINSINNSPQLSGIEVPNLEYTEGFGSIVITGTIIVNDPDNQNLTGASIGISGGYTPGEDILDFTNSGGINGSWDTLTGIMSLTGVSSVASYQAALRTIRYANTNTNNPDETLRTVSFYVSDSLSVSNTVARNINVTGVNDPPILNTLETTAIIYHEGENPVNITSTLNISDPDNTDLNSAIVSISENYVQSEDLLVFTDQSGIAGIWNAASGNLNLSGNASIEEYREAIGSISYINNNQINPSALTRELTISVNDGNLNSNAVIRDLDIIPVNDPPAVQNVTISGNMNINSVLTGNYTYTDPENDAEGASIYRWYLSANSSGDNRTLISGASSRQYQIQYNNGGKWISFTVNPRDINGDTAAAGVSSPWYYINAAPVANDLNIEGLIGLYQTVTASFSYNDLEGDPENPVENVYRWYRATDDDGSGKTLVAATKSYGIVDQDDEMYISFEITPAASAGSLYGLTVQSSWFGPIGRLPNALISGNETVCPGNEAILSVRLTTGSPPWNLTYTINNQNPQTVSGISTTTYSLSALQEGSYKLVSVSASGKAGTVSGEASVVYRIIPTARLSGGGTICEGTTANMRVDLTGSPPFLIRYRNNSSVAGTVSNIFSSTEFFGVKTAGNYTLTEVSDQYCKGTVSGSALVTLLPAPDVEIQGLNSVYSVNNDPIPAFGVPPGGTFEGDGLIPKNDTIFFLPSWAGVENSPHKISYFYQSPANGCMGKDTIMIDILEVHADISFPKNKTLFCYNDPPFEVRGLNLEELIGNFSISGGGVGLVDNGNNTATITPSELSGGEYEIIYRYFNKIWLEYREKFRIEFVSPIWFVGFEQNTFCSKENPVMLTGNIDDGIFYGNSVTGNLSTGFLFNPKLAPSAADTIFYIYTSVNGCKREIFEAVTIKPSPVIRFHPADSCILQDTKDSVIFINNTISSDSVVSWYWDFDDIESGENNYSNVENPKHYYAIAGTRYVMLRATTDQGCTATKESRVNLGDKPHADFNWSTECYLPDQPIMFTNQSETYIGILNKFNWRILLADSTITSDSENISYTFPETGDYQVNFKVETNYGCTDSITRVFSLKPTVNISDSPYYEDFETGKNGWIKTVNFQGESNSWEFGFSESNFPGLISGAYCWYTDIITGEEEQSWIVSPCFDFSNSIKPMIKFNAWRSFDLVSDGAVMQYTEDNGKQWNNVGAMNDGINWYNAYDIQGEPGGQSIGWSNIRDNDWLEMRHSLDSLVKKSLVQFRIAYGSNGTYGNNKGFAFDNIWIGERKKVVLLEHFTNSSDSLCSYAGNILSDATNNLSQDVINLQYHTAFPGEDPLSTDNPIVPEVRVFYYGILSVPYTLLNGGSGNLSRFDYYLKDLSRRDIIFQSLLDPVFKLDIQTVYNASNVDIEVYIEDINPLPRRELNLHIVVVENEITGIAGENGETRFYDVVKALVPDPAGTYIYKSWEPGDYETLYYTWEYEKVYDISQLRVVAFIQDIQTKEVYQSAIDKFDVINSVTDKPVIKREHFFDIIPNPATDYFQIRFKYPLVSDCYITVCSMDGRVFTNEIIKAGTRIQIMDSESFAHGVYVINIFSDKQILGSQWILINNRP